MNVLYCMIPKWYEKFLGLGLITFYWDFFNMLDAIFILMLWIYLGLHIQGNYNITYEDYLKVGEWISFREIHSYLTMEVNVLAVVVFFASIKLLEYLMEVSLLNMIFHPPGSNGRRFDASKLIRFSFN